MTCDCGNPKPCGAEACQRCLAIEATNAEVRRHAPHDGEGVQKSRPTASPERQGRSSALAPRRDPKSSCSIGTNLPAYAEAWKVSCPRCLALVDRPCVTTGSGGIQYPHPDRLAVAAGLKVDCTPLPVRR